MADQQEQEDGNGCVNLLYLASTRGENCNPRELVQNQKQRDVLAANQPAGSSRNTSKGSSRVGDKGGQKTAVKPKSGSEPEAEQGQGDCGSSTEIDIPHDVEMEIHDSPGTGRRNADDGGARPDCPEPVEPDAETSSSPDVELEELDNIRNTQKYNDGPDRARTVETRPKRVPVDRICFGVHCPEKIVICFDMSQELEKVSFRSRAGDKFAPLGLVKRALGIFLHTKHRMDARHEFALVVLRDTALWMCDFTNDPSKIITVLEDLQAGYQTETFDMASIFDEITQRVGIPRVDDPTVIPPSYVLRVLFMYGRSNCIPKFSNHESVRLLQSSPHFFLDAFYIHEPPSEDNDAEAIFGEVCKLDTNGLSYVFEVSRNPTKLYDRMAQLLPHPLQRALQGDAFYSIETKPDPIQ